MPSPNAIYRFGPYELRTRARELYKHGVKVRLRPQPFQVLHILLERAGDVITREELRKELWPAETFVDFEHGLNTAIKELRGVLSDSAGEPRYIETLPRLGYRLIARVEAETAASREVGAPEIANQVKPAGDEGAVHEPEPAAAKRTHWAAPVGLAAVLILGLAGYWQWGRAKAARQRVSERRMLAVLPFENLTGDASQDYFSDGLTEEMISQLGRLDPQHLGVIARTSVMHYRQGQEPLEQIGRELAVQYVLEGSVRRESGQVRISAQLIQMKDQTHLWSRQYDRQLGSLLALQGEIAQEIADEIQLALGERNPDRVVPRTPLPAPTSEAYDLHLRGLYFWNKRTVAGFQQAIESFQQAIAKDPNYARAFAGLADSYALIADYGTQPPEEFMSKARASALKALEIDPSLPEAHTTFALILQSHDWDWQTAEKEFRRAIELNPNYATAHHWYAEHLMWRGRFDEALQESEQARQLDPLSLIIAADNGAILYYSRQYDRAIEKLHSVLEMDPDYPRALLIVPAYAEKGRVTEALALIEAHRLQMSIPYYWAFLAHVYGRTGRTEPARHALNELLRLNPHAPIDPVMLAWACAETSENDQALAWLEKAYEQHSTRLVGLKVNPVFDPLRNDPRFQDLLRRVGLADPPGHAHDESRPAR